jgi:hypothetical protein
MAGHVQLVDVRVENTVHESNARGFVWVGIREFNVNLPHATLERSCPMSARLRYQLGVLTLGGTLEPNKKFLPGGSLGDEAVAGREGIHCFLLARSTKSPMLLTVVVDQSDLIVAHEPVSVSM